MASDGYEILKVALALLALLPGDQNDAGPMLWVLLENSWIKRRLYVGQMACTHSCAEPETLRPAQRVKRPLPDGARAHCPNLIGQVDGPLPLVPVYLAPGTIPNQALRNNAIAASDLEA